MHCLLSLGEVRGRGLKVLSSRVFEQLLLITPPIPYKCTELSWPNDPEAVRDPVTCCIPGACSTRACCGLVLGAWETHDQQSRLQECLPAQRVEKAGIF